MKMLDVNDLYEALEDAHYEDTKNWELDADPYEDYEVYAFCECL